MCVDEVVMSAEKVIVSVTKGFKVRRELLGMSCPGAVTRVLYLMVGR